MEAVAGDAGVAQASAASAARATADRVLMVLKPRAERARWGRGPVLVAQEARRSIIVCGYFRYNSYLKYFREESEWKENNKDGSALIGQEEKFEYIQDLES
ncbi:hypothetical protein PC110_g19867 [Phytophthora cactorum]|uniref:Uncharacterized protein n=2 Tax=Phytophthora cactorum TaxID=29920 RepID=A0A329RK65_9STRA|nr:hypothetical protein PC112_g14544 [Phytophthora cactorum]RAW23702.1 hypothetical protein PC110_g19867 [Phytophthora cactorum]